MSLASFVLTTIPLVACTLGDGSYDSCYDDPYGCHSSPPPSSYNPGYGYDAAPQCAQQFTTTFYVSDTAGACRVELSAYEGSYSSQSYFFAAPNDGELVTCSAFGSPPLGVCTRVDGVITLATATQAELDALRVRLGTSTSVFAEITCEHALGSNETVAITCAEEDAGAPAKPDAAPDANPDAGEAGCGP
jgi:hypothetical protein